MIIWRGWGLMIPLFGFILGWCGCALGYVLEPNSSQFAKYGVIGGEIAAAIAIFTTMKFLQSKRMPEKIGSFFFVPTPYWLFILPAIAIIASFIGDFPPNAQIFWRDSFSL